MTAACTSVASRPAAGEVAAQPIRFVSMYEKSAKIYPRSVQGRYAQLRWLIVGVTQAVFFGLPWLHWNGRQAVFFDLDAPRFHVFGLVLQPQDLVFLAGLMVIAALALFFFTALAGRLWCGYACPQTVYSEIYQWIELKAEGDRHARIRLDAQPWTFDKLRRRAAKHALWLAVALAAGFTFVGYFVPIRGLPAQLAQAGLVSWPVFWLLYAGVLHGHAGFMREQICKYMCPYARIQSTLIDGDSLVIAYDSARGEPRGSRPRRTDPLSVGLGSCTDCTLCVQVCPAGIDIRNGLQNECIGCAACIDACDDVMKKMDYPTGLIRYATSHAVERKLTRPQMLRRMLRPRVLVYGALLSAAGTAFAVGLALRTPVGLDLMRDRGVMARLGDDGHLENLYRVKLTNRGERALEVRLSAHGLAGLAIDPAAPLKLEPGEVRALAIRLSLAPAAAAALEPGARPVRVAVTESGQAVPAVQEKTTFVVPR
ncbi:MAG: cytochrome c oxidase accessory protein CcoG [Burkholderiales bacterium]|nr:cytochrome c oxidase accessory protein CcoG [Burkholderiales bacterium]